MFLDVICHKRPWTALPVQVWGYIVSTVGWGQQKTVLSKKRLVSNNDQKISPKPIEKVNYLPLWHPSLSLSDS